MKVTVFKQVMINKETLMRRQCIWFYVSDGLNKIVAVEFVEEHKLWSGEKSKFRTEMELGSYPHEEEFALYSIFPDKVNLGTFELDEFWKKYMKELSPVTNLDGLAAILILLAEDSNVKLYVNGGLRDWIEGLKRKE